MSFFSNRKHLSPDWIFLAGGKIFFFKRIEDQPDSKLALILSSCRIEEIFHINLKLNFASINIQVLLSGAMNNPGKECLIGWQFCPMPNESESEQFNSYLIYFII